MPEGCLAEVLVSREMLWGYWNWPAQCHPSGFGYGVELGVDSGLGILGLAGDGEFELRPHLNGILT